jgi:branched-chain amino acid aminotransferase
MSTHAAAALSFPVTASEAPTATADRDAILAEPGFGRHFTDHMAVATWTPDDGWHDDRVQPYAPLTLDPAAAVLHYAQEIFEGMKAYRHPDGSIWAFRPRANAARFVRSAERMALPALPEDDFMAALESLVATDRAWVPSLEESSLYLRPFMFASETFLGVRPARHVTFMMIASPVGPYFASGPAPVTIWLSRDYTRAAPGGTGAAKAGGNYAASLAAQQEAAAHGCAQVCFLDAVEQRWVEELGGMNLFFVYEDGSIVTPELSGTILPGITRSSVITIAEEAGHKVDERRFGIDEWYDGVESGEITEVFACGTAAVITPLGRLEDGERTLTIGDGETAGEVTMALRRQLVDIQYGRADDPHGWLQRLA